MSKSILNTPKAPEPIGPYNQAVSANGLLFVSGQIPLSPQTKQLCTGTAAEQTKLVMTNIEAILANAGTSFANVVKTVIFLADMNDFAAVNEVYGQYFTPETAPARSCVQVAKLPKGAAVEIEVIALQ